MTRQSLLPEEKSTGGTRAAPPKMERRRRAAPGNCLVDGAPPPKMAWSTARRPRKWSGRGPRKVGPTARRCLRNGRPTARGDKGGHGTRFGTMAILLKALKCASERLHASHDFTFEPSISTFSANVQSPGSKKMLLGFRWV